MAYFRAVRTGIGLFILWHAARLLSGCTTSNPPAWPSPASPPAAGGPEQSVLTPPRSEAPAAPLTVDAAIQRALVSNSQIAALRAAVTVAEQRKRAATDITDPEFQFTWWENSVDGLRQRWGTQETVTASSSSQTSIDSRTTTGSTFGPDGLLESTSLEVLNTTNRTSSSSRSRETRASVTTGSTTEETDGYRLGVRLFVPNPWLLVPRVSARKAEIQAAEADLHAAEWLIACDVRRYFAELNYLTNDLALATDLVNFQGEILKAVKARTEHGAATAFDVLTAARQQLQVRNALDLIRQRRKLALRGLAALLNVSSDSLQIDATRSTPPLLPSGISVDEIEMLALQRRADVVACHWRVLAAEAAYRESRNVRLPWIKEIDASYRAAHGDTWGSDVTTDTGHDSGTSRSTSTADSRGQQIETEPNGDVTTTPEQRLDQGQSVTRSRSTRIEHSGTWIADEADAEEWQVGFAIDVPIFSWLKNHAADAMLAEYKLASVRETEGLRLASREVRDAADELEESRRQEAYYATDVEPVIAEMRKALATMESTPNVMPDQLASAKVQVADSARLQLQSRYRYDLAAIALERALGTPLAEAMNRIAPHSAK
jgi:outer membrane protein TolC